jgi:lysyl-tRNA synthetase class 2
MAMDSIAGPEAQDTVVVLARDEHEDIKGVLHFVPVYGRCAVSLSFMRRDPATPNGLTEFLVARGAELLRERGVQEMSLNFAAFAKWIHSPERRHERLLGRLVALGNPFFQIESLYRFNAKFFPRWEPRYLVYDGALGLPRAGLAAMWAEGQLWKPALPQRPAAFSRPATSRSTRTSRRTA